MTKQSSDPFTKEVLESIRISAHYVHDFKTLRRHRMQCFNDQGMVLIVDKKNGVERLGNGREFICENIAFFEAKDESYAYRICAELKIVMDEYDSKFLS